MAISHLLEDFGNYARGKPVSLTDVSLEEQRLEAFEKGYQAGWDDSAKAASEDSRHITADFAQNLKDVSLTYEEASSAVIAALKPLLDQIMDRVLPNVMRGTLGAQVAEQLHELAKQHGPQAIELVTAPANVAALHSVLDATPAMSVSVVEEASLGDGQVFIRFGDHEREIDLGGVLAAIEQNIAGFFEENRKDTE